MLELLIIAVSFVLVAFVAGNNLAACSGSIIGSRIASRRTGILIAILGYIFGFLLQGHMLRKGVEALMPYKQELMILDALSIATVVFIIAHRARVPQSLSMSFASIILGISVAEGASINMLYTAEMLLFWIIAPVASFLIALLLMKFSSRHLGKRHIWRTASKLKLLSIAIAFFTAFTLGANTIGFLYASIPGSNYALLSIIIAIIAGSIFLSGAELRRIGNEIIPIRYLSSVNTQLSSLIVVEAATLFGIPLSNTQTYTASIYGAGMSYAHRLLLKRPAVAIVGTWVAVAAISFLLAFLTVLVFLR